MQLHGTPLSHFTRKVRILLAELGVPYTQVWSPNVMTTATAAYGDNPMMRIPTLVDDTDTIIDSDHIARHVVGKHDPADRMRVCSEAVVDLNRLAVTNGIMDNEVVLILARRGGGIADFEAVTYFRKLATGMDNGLAWLEAHVIPDAPFDYRDITLVCMWQHAAHYKMMALEPYPRLEARVARFADRASVASTAPAAAVVEATAAGWNR